MMTPEEQSSLRDLAKRIHDEKDPIKLMALAQEMNQFLERTQSLPAIVHPPANPSRSSTQ